MRPHAWIALLLAASTLAVFYQVRHHEFVGYDDYVYVVQNANLRDGMGLRALAWAFRPYEVNWIPLTWISLQLDYTLHGLEPAGFLLTNVALHVASSLLLYAALASATGAVWRSAVVAAVFALHPLHVESVAWVTERKDTLSGLFFMLTLCAYVGYARRPGSPGRYALVLLCLAAGLMAKPMLVSLPCVLLLLDYWPLRRLALGKGLPAWRALRPLVLEKLPMLALAALAAGVTYHVQSSAGSVSPLETFPLRLRVENALDAYAVYVWKALWPTGLAAFYPHSLESLGAGRLALAGGFLALVTLAAARTAVSRPYAIVGWLWYLGTLVPVIGLVQVGMQARADRYTYLPLIGLSICAVWTLADLAERRGTPRPARAAVALAALLGLALLAWRQVGTWRTTEALYQRALSVTRGNFLAHQGLGNALLLQGDYAEAARHFAAARELAPLWHKPRLGLADVAIGEGRLDEAMRLYREELRRDPDDVDVIGRYGIALGLAGRHAEARPYLERALLGRAGTAELHLGLAIVEAALGRPGESLRHGREALRIAPRNLQAANAVAWTLATAADASLRDPPQAIALIEAPALETGDPWLLDTLAAAYASAGRFREAAATAERASAEAENRGQAAEAAAIRDRVSLYRAGQAYLDAQLSGSGASAP